MKKIKIIAIVGKSGSGKDFWLRNICENDEEVHEIVSCTTRPARWTEVNGRNYNFITAEHFMEQDFLESSTFNGWKYGTRKKDVDKNKVNIGVFNLDGIEQILENPDIDLTVICLYAEDKIRLIRQLERESANIDEIFRRYYADQKDFTKLRLDKIKEQVPLYFIYNNSNSFDDKEFIFSDFNKIINEVKSR